MRWHRFSFALAISAMVLAVVALFVFYTFAVPRTHAYAVAERAGTLVNPVYALSTEQARTQFNSTFIFYLLYKLHVYDLHTPPLSSDTPRLMIDLGDAQYGVEIVRGVISVTPGAIGAPDITIYSSKDEVIGMLRNEARVKASFDSGKSSFKPHVGKALLFAKGYLHVYEQAYSKTITGNVVKLTSD